MIWRNSLLSVASLALPLLVGLFSVPPIIAALGIERFGALTLAWAIIGYAGVFDLGIGRALTRRVAELGARPARVAAIARLGLVLLLGLGMALGVAVLLAAPLFDHRRLGLAEVEYANAMRLLAASVPLVILGGGLRGVLEGQHRFAVVSLVRLGFGLVTFLAPLLVLEQAPRLDAILAIMLGTRLIGSLVMAWACRRQLEGGRLGASRRAVEARRMLRFGGWVTVSNLASALMLYLDRFFLASGAQASTLAFYTTPYEFVTKLFIVPSALGSVLFPSIASRARQGDTAPSLLAMGCGAVLLSVVPVVAVLILFAETVLGVWIDPAFARTAAPVLVILSAGVLLNCLAQLFQTALLGHGWARWMAALHLVECLFYVPALYLAVQRAGIEGAAWVWTLRVASDALAMAWRLDSLRSGSSAHWAALVLAMVLLGLLGLADAVGLQVRLVLGGGVIVAGMVGGAWLLWQAARHENTQTCRP